MMQAMEKVCSKCKESKKVAEFSPRGDGYQSWCRACNRARYHENKEYGKKVRASVNEARRIRYAERLALTDELKDVPCADCGVRFPSVCMDFDHRDPNTKEFNISRSLAHRSWESILAEIAKCDVVCANCHRIRTHIVRR